MTQNYPNGLQLSDRIYRKFLVAYSTEYRQEYGDEMAQVFRDLCLEVYRERGGAGLIGLWAATIFDLLKTATEERLDAFPLPSGRILQPLGGWASIVGGLLTIIFAFTHASPNWIDWVFRLNWIWPAMGFLYLLALLGLGAFQRSNQHSVGAGLVIAVTGALVMIVSGFYIYNVSRIWISFRDGLVIGAVGFLVMGLFHRRGDFSPRIKKLLVVLGAFILLTALFVPAGFMGYLFEGDTTLFAISMGLCWIAIGLVLLTGRDGLIQP